MNQIKFIKNLSFSPEGELVSVGSKGKAAEVFLRQGDLDCACAVYSLMMLLIMNRKINRRELSERGKIKGYTSVMRLQDEFLASLPGSYKDGYFFNDLRDKLSASFKKVATAESYTTISDKKRDDSVTKEELHDKIRETIEAGFPVEIGFSRKRGNSGHAVVAIGYGGSKNDSDTLRLFCLDPGYELHKQSFWNTIIDINLNPKSRATYQDYNYSDVNNEICNVDEILIIKN